MIGRIVGTYRVLRVAGAGAMGQVYHAEDIHLGRPVALKLIAAAAVDPQSRARFLREARALAALNHQNIATLYEAGDAEGVPFLAMEWVEGPTLEQTLCDGPLPVSRLLQVAIDVASALEHAHSRGILHRDIKPSNIAVGADGRAKMLDFGLARALEAGDETHLALTDAGVVVGTLHYLAPDAIAGDAPNPKTDIYSLGVVMYEMACGDRPFAGNSGPTLMAAILQGRRRSLGDRSTGLPAPLIDIIERAMATDPGARYARAGELSAALTSLDLGSGQIASARQPSDGVMVMDFRNLSADPAMDWLGTGLAETIAAELKRAGLVRVISRERLHEILRRDRLADEPAGVRELGRVLGARWAVTGSYQRAGDHVRLTPRLIDASTLEVTATAKIDGSWADVFALQDRVVAELIAALEESVGRLPENAGATADTRHLEAYEHYSEGRRLFYLWTKQSMESAIQHLERAVRLDPKYTPAHSTLGAVHAFRFIHRTDPEDLSRAIMHLERARELDPELGEPYHWLCYAYGRQGHTEKALRAGREAVVRQPDLVQSHYYLGGAHLFCAPLDPDRHYQEAAEELLRAVDIEPGWEPAWMFLATIAMAVGEYSRAEQFIWRSREIEYSTSGYGRFIGADMLLGALQKRRGELTKAREAYGVAVKSMEARDHMYREAFLAMTACGLGEIELRTGAAEAALAQFRRAWRLVQEFPRMLGSERVTARTQAGFSAAYARLGDFAQAETHLLTARETLTTVEKKHHTTFWEAATPQLVHAVAVAETVVGHYDAALITLDHAVAVGWRDPHWLAADPALAPLRAMQEFRSILSTLAAKPAVRFEAAVIAAR
jgi:TolB-like protein/Flp pilus assembly protein TadD